MDADYVSLLLVQGKGPFLIITTSEILLTFQKIKPVQHTHSVHQLQWREKKKVRESNAKLRKY